MRFLHFGFHFIGAAKVAQLNAVFDQAPDWLRYSGNCWIVRTDKSADWWANQLKPSLGPQDSLLIFQVNLKTRWGFADKWIWEWIDKQR